MEDNYISINLYSFATLGATIEVVSSAPVVSDLIVEAESFGDSNATSHTFCIPQGQTSDLWIDRVWATAEWRILSVSPQEDWQYKYVG